MARYDAVCGVACVDLPRESLRPKGTGRPLLTKEALDVLA
jgi:hypothetical protein